MNKPRVNRELWTTDNDRYLCSEKDITTGCIDLSADNTNTNVDSLGTPSYLSMMDADYDTDTECRFMNNSLLNIDPREIHEFTQKRWILQIMIIMIDVEIIK